MKTPPHLRMTPNESAGSRFAVLPASGPVKFDALRGIEDRLPYIVVDTFFGLGKLLAACYTKEEAYRVAHAFRVVHALREAHAVDSARRIEHL
jgi:hypothetical protein